MTELASRTALGGVVGDTHLGQEIHRVYADGEYDWVALRAGKTLSKDLAVYSVPETGPAEPFTDGAQGTGAFISSTSGVVPAYTPDIDKTVTSIDYTLRSNTAGAAAGRFLAVRTGGPTGLVVASNAATVFTIPGNTTLNGTAILGAPLNMTAGTTYFVTLEAPAGLLGFFALGDADPQLGFSNGSAADPALAFNGTQAGSLPFNVSFVTDGVTERYEAVDQGDPTRIVRGDMPLPATWTLVETDATAPTDPPLVTAWDNTKADYQQGEWVATGGELFVSNANQTAVNDPSGDTGEHWTQYPARRAYEYSILADQFSSYQGTWADLINYYVVERGWTVTRIEVDENAAPAAFDFNDDGNPITLAVGESVEYDGAQWVKAGAVTTTTVTLTGTTDADDQTTIPYAGDVKNGYLVEIEVSADRWLPQNYGDRTDEAANYFQVLYDEGQARFEMWAVGTALQGKPYRIAVYGTAPAEAPPDPAPSVERVVAVKNPGFGTILGDFNFIMPGGGNRSIQIRTVSGTIAYTDFNTYWSAGAGGANDAPLAGNWDETWRYAANFNMTAHNQYQHVEFIANGWFYHVHMVVGATYNNNRFTLTRWKT